MEPITIAPLKIKVTFQQKEFDILLEVIQKEINACYDRFLENIVAFNQIFNGSSQSNESVLSQGYVASDTLTKALKNWQAKYTQGYIRASSEKLKIPSYTLDKDRLYEVTMMTTEALQIESAKEKEQWPIHIDCHQRPILNDLWELKWKVCDERYHTLDEIVGNGGLWYTPFLLITESRDKSGLSISNLNWHARTVDNILSDLYKKIENYKRLFTLDSKQIIMAEKLAMMQELSQKIYKESLNYIIRTQGASLPIFLGNVKGIVTKELNNTSEPINAWLSNWIKYTQSPQGLSRPGSDYLLVDAFKPQNINPKRIGELIQKIKPCFPSESLIFALEEILIGLVSALHIKTCTLTCEFAKAIYSWNHFRLSQEYLSAGIFRADHSLKFNSTEFSHKLDIYQKYVVYLTDRLPSAMSDRVEMRKRIEKKITVTEKEAALLKRIEAARTNIRTKYRNFHRCFHSFPDQLSSCFDLLKEDGMYSEVVTILDALAPRDNSSRNIQYWVYEKIPSKESLVSHIDSQKEQVAKMKEPDISSKKDGHSFELQKDLAFLLLDIKYAVDSLYYGLVESADSYESMIAVRENCQLKIATMNLRNQLMQGNQTYNRVMKDPYLVVINRFLDLRGVALQHYQTLLYSFRPDANEPQLTPKSIDLNESLETFVNQCSHTCTLSLELGYPFDFKGTKTRLMYALSAPVPSVSEQLGPIGKVWLNIVHRIHVGLQHLSQGIYGENGNRYSQSKQAKNASRYATDHSSIVQKIVQDIQRLIQDSIPKKASSKTIRC